MFEAEVQAGTYIRTLCVDLGEKIGGAHMLELRRTKAGIFTEENLVNLYDFEKAVEEHKKGDESFLRSVLIPAEILSTVLPVIQVKESSVKQLLTGKPIHKSDISFPAEFKIGEKILAFHSQTFIEAASIINQGDIIAKPEFVFN